MYNYDLFALLYGRNQHNIVRQFSSIKKKKSVKTSGLWNDEKKGRRVVR